MSMQVSDARSPTAQIHQHGFAVIDAVFDAREVDALLGAIGKAEFARGRAGVRHAMRHAVVADLARDARLLQIAREVLGPGALPYRATLFDKSPVSNWLVVWHQDTALPLRQRNDQPGWGPWSTKAGILYSHAPASALERVLALRIHLDDSMELNGPLRVLPGTHTRGVLPDDVMRDLASAHGPVDCIVLKGGVLAMRPLLVHASSKSRSEASRRVLHIEYAVSMQIAPGFELALA